MAPSVPVRSSRLRESEDARAVRVVGRYDRTAAMKMAVTPGGECDVLRRADRWCSAIVS